MMAQRKEISMLSRLSRAKGGLPAALLAGGLLAPLAALPHAQAAGAHSLGRKDFYGFTSRSNDSSPSAGTYYLDHDPAAVVAGVAYPRVIDLHPYGNSAPAGISLNTARFPGYRALTFAIGIEDGNPVNTTADVRVTVNGRTVRRTRVRQGQISVRETLPFGRGEQVISIVATAPGGFADVIVGGATVLPGRPR